MGNSAHDSRSPQDNIEFSRRRFLRVAGGIAGGAVAVPFLASCAPSLPAAAPTRPAATAGTSSGASAVYPSYMPFATGPKADFPASAPMYDDAFSTYPANPVKALGDPPGAGSTVNIMSIQLFPPPTIYEQN